jgi:Zn-finger nucleic acid-binding protein
VLIACTSCHRQYDVSGMRPGEPFRCHCGELTRVAEPVLHEAETIHCPRCGGKIRPRAPHCDYCGSALSLADHGLGVACPECFARLAVEARYCRACGVEIRPERVQAARVDARCPRCRGELTLCRSDAVEYTECTVCGGIWLEERLFERALSERDAAAFALVGKGAGRAAALGRGPESEAGPGRRPGPGSGPQPGPGPGPGRQSGARASAPPRDALPEGEVRYLPCPVCGGLMQRQNFAKVSGVIIDWCRGHGFWFDTHELESVMAFVRDGGLDRSRAHEIARQEERLRQAERRERQRRGHGARTAAAGEDLFGVRPRGGASFFDVLLDCVGELVGKAL